MIPLSSKRSDEGVALVVTLVLLVLLAGMAVALLLSSGVDRGSSKAVADKAKADLLAQTAVNAAIAQLVDTLNQYPDSATTWETINGNDGTVLYYHDKTPDQAITSGTAAQLFVLPLASGATAQLVANKTSALPVLTEKDVPGPANAFNLNRPRTAGDKIGEVGSSPQWLATTPTTPQPFRGAWVNTTNSKVTGRYAFWMEDDSFKANANLMGSTARGSATLGNSFSQVPFQGILKGVLTGSPDYDSIAGTIVSYRGQFPGSLFFNFRDLNQVSGQATLADNAKFEATLYSGSANLSRSGAKRVNLNQIVSTSTDSTEIRKQLDEIIKTITIELPNFGQRFYRNGTDKNSLDVLSTGSPSHQTIYLNKVAANIRDYIDTDSQPTIINSDLSVNIGSVPARSLPNSGASGANPVIAVGKDAVPQIQEYVLRVKQIQPIFKASSTALSQPYQIEIDHYVEFWNMTDKDIKVSDLGGHPFLRIANQFGWTSYGGDDINVDPNRDFSIPLSQFTNSSGTALIFAAGKATVLTTDPVALPSTFSGIDPSRIFRPSAGTPADSLRVYKGNCKPKSTSSYPHLDSKPRPGGTTPSSSTDTETEIILGNDSGILDSFGAPAVYYLTVNADDGTQSRPTKYVDQTMYHFRASSLKGNAIAFNPTSSQTGDPRTNNEQLSLSSTSAVSNDQTSYKTELNSNSPPSTTNNDASPTGLNTTYVFPNLWIDPATNATDAAHAPMVIANTQITSIAELGNVFDPARAIGATPSGSGNILYSRGGGRTFKIGQADDLWDGSSTSASREWTSWRLADVFSANNYLQLDGRININGVNRDAGAAFRAALYGYNFAASPDSDPTIAAQALTDAQVTSLITQMQDRVSNKSFFTTTVGPFAELGEFSEMPVFNSGTQLTGQDMSTIYDRGREEILRRLAELITTRGNIFSVYAVGQSVVPQPVTGSTPVVTSTAQIKVTFRIDPVWNDTIATTDPFDPANPNARLRKPDKYAIKILYAGD